MSEHHFPFPACVTAGKGRIEAHDLALLRKHTFASGIASREDAHTLVALHRRCPHHCPEWEDFFTESLAAYVVFHEEPFGAVDECKASWLISLCAENGAIVSALELSAILHVMDLSARTCDSLRALVLDQVRWSLLPDSRCAHADGRPGAPAVTAYDLALIWRVLASGVDEGHLTLSPPEALVLNEIDRLTDPGQNHPLWNQMLAQIVTLQRPGDELRAIRNAMAADSLSASDFAA